MAFNLKNRSLLTLRDYTPREIAFLIKLAADLKTAKYAGTEVPRLQGKDIALIFEKDSTRTRVGFEVAAYDQGARVTYLGPTGSHIGHKERVKDTARVLGRVYDAIEYRGFGQKIVEELAEYSGVPVYNGLTDEFHPTQILADFLTMQEHMRKAAASGLLCLHRRCGQQHGRQPVDRRRQDGHGCAALRAEGLLAHTGDPGEAQAIAAETGARIMITEISTTQSRVSISSIPMSGSRWAKPKEKWAERIKLLMPYQVNAALMAQNRQPAHPVHALPARLPQHRDRRRRGHRGAVRHHRHGGDRRGVRKPSLDRLRSGRKPDAHDQGGACRHTGEPEMLVVAALGGNALLKRGQPLTAEAQRANVTVAAEALAGIVRAGHRLVDHPWQRSAGRPSGAARCRLQAG